MQGCGIFGFLANTTCGNKFSNKNMQFWLKNARKKGVGKLSSSRVGTNHRGMHFDHEMLVESIPLWND